MISNPQTNMLEDQWLTPMKHGSWNLEMAHPRGFEPLTSAFGGLRAMFKAFVAGRYSGRLKKVDEK